MDAAYANFAQKGGFKFSLAVLAPVMTDGCGWYTH
jgi:hypothetical protein